MDKKISRVIITLLLLSPSILHGRISKRTLLRKICCLQGITNRICSELETIKNSTGNGSAPTPECATLITQGDVVENSLIIESPGVYKLCEDLENACIDIVTDNVTLDLNGYSISGNCSAVILVGGGIQNFVIKNGSIKNNPNLNGIQFESATHSNRVENVEISNCFRGIIADSSNNNIISNCTVKNCGDGIFIRGDNNIISECIIENISNDTIPFSPRGIGLVDPSKNNFVFNNTVDNISKQTGSCLVSQPFGIFDETGDSFIVGNYVSNVNYPGCDSAIGILTIGKAFHNTSLGNDINYVGPAGGGVNGNY